MKKLYSCYVLCLLLLVGVGAYGQDFNADLTKVREAYRNANSFRSEVSMVISNEPGGEVIMSQRAEICWQGERFLYAVDASEWIFTGQAMLWVHHENKQIQYQPSLYNATLSGGFVPGDMLDSLIKNYDRVEFKGKNGNIKHYRIFKDSSDVTEINLYLNAVNSMVHKIAYRLNEALYEQKLLVTISYHNPLANTQFPPGFFSIERYLRKSGHRWYPVTTYQGYTVIAPEDE